MDKRNLLTGDGLPVPFVTLLFVPYMLLLRMVLLEVLINIIQHKLQWNGTSGALFIFAQIHHTVWQRLANAVHYIGQREDTTSTFHIKPRYIMCGIAFSKRHNVHLLLIFNPRIGDFISFQHFNRVLLFR